MDYFVGYFISIVLMAVLSAAIWVLTGLLHLSGMAEMLVRSLLIGLLMGGFGYFYYHRSRKQQKSQPDAAQLEASDSEREVADFIRAAEARLASSNLGKEAKLGQLPVFFVIGEGATAKTSMVVHSGMEPDLLAGQVYQDSDIVPTRPVNIWLAQKSVFVEAGGPLLSDPNRWVRLVKRLQPLRRRIFEGRQAPRAVVVCVDTELFLQSGAAEKLASLARALHTRIGELSHILGSRLPIYVLFSKLDRLASFSDFFRNLTEEEVHQVVGVTFPMRSTREQGGVFAEEESRRLTAAFEALFGSLCGKRLPFLAREGDPQKLGAVYEFPREFRKLRAAAVKFLVDLSRPSQLRAEPFLRGFYFAGVRPVTVADNAPLARAASSSTVKKAATGFFALDAEGVLVPASSTGRTRRVPQWLFLGHLFNHVILPDKAAAGASGLSRHREMARRFAVAAAACLFLLWSFAMTVSYFRNRSLEASVGDAARAIGASEAGGAGQQLPSRDALEKLDALRAAVQQLSAYQQQGPPLSLRWGLYVGDDLYPPARALYFNRFAQLLFTSTQASLLDWMRKLPAKPGPNDEYKPTYDTLKAYLITTSHHEKSTRQFLSPLMMERWQAGRNIDPDLAAIVRRQWDFYADELVISNPYSSAADNDAVEQARNYLAQFNAIESIYQYIIAEASRLKPAVNFNKQFPGSAQYISSSMDVPGAFTIDGWKFVDDAITNVKKFFGGEAWVLGNHANTNVDPVAIIPELRARYRKDYISDWRGYLADSSVVPYKSVSDAAQKLSQLSSNQSYLLGLLCVASVNTNVPDADTAAPYQPVQYVEPPACTDRYIQGPNSQYASALVNLQSSMDRVAKASGAPPDELVNEILNDAQSAYKVTRQIAQNFRTDRDGNVHTSVEKLLEEPIHNAEGLLGRLGPAQINADAKRFCGDFGDLNKKYPFNTTSQVDATLDEIDAIFRPGDGKVASFAENNLRNYIEKQGNQYVRKPDSRVQVTDAFLRFLNRAAGLTEALYKNGGRDPNLTYTMKALTAEGLKSVTLSVDGQVLKSTVGGESKDFTWPGTAVRGAKLSGNLGAGDFGFITYDGLWSAFRFFGDADRFQASGSSYTLQWVPRQGQSAQPIRLDDGKPLTLPFLLDLKGAPPIFQKGYLSGFQCVSDAAR